MDIKLHTRTALLGIMAAVAVAMLFFRLENWVQHEANPLMLLVMLGMIPACVVINTVQIVQGIRKKAWLWIVLSSMAAIVCLLGIYNYWKIPFCLECNGGVTEAELGWMAPWFFP